VEEIPNPPRIYLHRWPDDRARPDDSPWCSETADYLLFHHSNQPIAVIEAKDNNHSVGAGIQQAQGYAAALGVPFVFSSNGDAFLLHDDSGTYSPIEQEIPLNAFPSPEDLWQRYLQYQQIPADQGELLTSQYYTTVGGKTPRYYQQLAVNRTIEAIAKGQKRCLLVMATGSGKTYTVFNIIWRLWKTETVKRVLFLADRNALVDQTITNDFVPFGDKKPSSPASCWMTTGASTPPMKFTWGCTRPSSATRGKTTSTKSSTATFLTWWWWTNATGAVRRKIPTGGRCWSIFRRPFRWG
jgi:hypothetical protein